jgi:tetratricopeptide (TPR) repeat protein
MTPILTPSSRHTTIFCFVLVYTAQACDLTQLPAALPALTSFELVEAGHDLRVKAILTPVVEAEPSNDVAAWLLSKSLTGLGELDAALKYAERAVSLAGDNADYHVQLGTVLGLMAEKASIFKQLGLARRARKELEAGVALDPQNLDGLMGVMLYYFSAPSFLGGDKAKAADYAARIAKVNAVRGWMARAALAKEQKNATAELDFSLRAVAEDPGSFDALSELAHYYLNRPQPDYSKLEEAGCKLVEIDPGRPDGWRALAEVHVASFCWTELAEVLEASERFNQEDLSPYYTAAVAMLRRGERLSTARDYLERYLAQPPEGSEPTHAMAHWQLATLLERQQHPDEAVEQLDLALKEDPGLEAAKKDLKRLRGK